MKRCCFILCVVLSACAASDFTQVPISVGIQILRAEDARRYDDVLRSLLKSPDAKIRERAALAAGRIGNDKAVDDLVPMLADNSANVRAMAAFAIGEVESIKGADPLLNILKNTKITGELRARAVEAVGKIAAANPKDDRARALGAAIIDVLNAEESSTAAPDILVVRLALTAALRARPAGADEIVIKFLAYHDPDVVCDALNTLARLRAKNANRDARDLLETNPHSLIRANAARLLGAAEDKDAFDSLLKAATSDPDSRVRVSAIRALGSLKNEAAAGPLLARGETLYAKFKDSKYRVPIEKSEILEIFQALARIFPNGGKNGANRDELILHFIAADHFRTREAVVAAVRISPRAAMEMLVRYDDEAIKDWQTLSAIAQGMGEAAKLDEKTVSREMRDDIGKRLNKYMLEAGVSKLWPAVPDLLTAYDALKAPDAYLTVRSYLGAMDANTRAVAAGLLAEKTADNVKPDELKQTIGDLKLGFTDDLLHDKHDNDAQLATMDALYKLDKKESVGTLLIALNATDYLVRKRAFELLADKDLQKDFPGIPTSLENARAKHKDQVLPFSLGSGTRLGQVLNTDADYRRALSRKNGSIRAVLKTEKGVFTIIFNPEEAPLTVDNWVKLARSGYFNGLEVHRVVPNFVMQDGDPRGDGNGGPGWSIRCEINMLPFDRGAVGMALSGKDTGGSQWFVDHSAQPHLDGGYTVFGHVNETDMHVVDSIVRGDKIISVTILER